MSSSSKDARPIPSSVLIVGSGVFGLSTAYALATDAQYEDTEITVVDRLDFPAPDASSIDTSRIIRADYADAAYSALAFEAQKHWRGPLGANGRYSENGLILTASADEDHYVQDSLKNVQSLLSIHCDPRTNQSLPSTQELRSTDEIRAATGTGGASGDVGYLNRCSGWADAEASMRYFHARVVALNRVTFITASVTKLLFAGAQTSSAPLVRGVFLDSGRALTADLTILAAGAWTPSLVDLRGIARATGQVLAYVPLNDAEFEALRGIPTLLHLTSGTFVLPPDPRTKLLKIARHGYGYTNPVAIPHPDRPLSSTDMITVSLPVTAYTTPSIHTIPSEGMSALSGALAAIVPSISPSRIAKTRICWYTDTPDGDFLFDYHPDTSGLFIATGGSGHAFKFLPVVGEEIVKCLKGERIGELGEKWRWKGMVGEEGWKGDGSRGGREEMVLWKEMRERGML